MSARIVVVGSLNTDHVSRIDRAPAAGETVLGHDFTTLLGGKGANQAVACARMGASVAMVGCVGKDAGGKALVEGLAAEGIDVTLVDVSPAIHTGTATIWVEADGQNRIVLAPGANFAMDPSRIEQAGRLIDAATMLIVQLEIPLPVVEAAIERAKRSNVQVLLNPAPAQDLPVSLLKQVDILVINESEASVLTGTVVSGPTSAGNAGAILRARGPQCVLVTLGAQGVVIVDETGIRFAPAQVVRTVDTTAAGDTFIGAVSTALCQHQTLNHAVELGQAASAICVGRRGAQASIPYRRELAAVETVPS